LIGEWQCPLRSGARRSWGPNLALAVEVRQCPLLELAVEGGVEDEVKEEEEEKRRWAAWSSDKI